MQRFPMAFVSRQTRTTDPTPAASVLAYTDSCTNAVNRDSFRDLGFWAALEFHRPSPGFRESSVPG